MSINNNLEKLVKDFFQNDFSYPVNNIEFQSTRREFEGDITIVLFPFIKDLKISFEELGNKIGAYLIKKKSNIVNFNIVKGFLNITISDKYYIEKFNEIYSIKKYGHLKKKINSPTIIVEYSSPNTNKPLHLGHIRNNLLGFSVSNILEANGYNVIRTQIINDRGIHICKSMVAWTLYGGNETPESSNLKGDFFVGKYYIKFNEVHNTQIKDLLIRGFNKEEANKSTSIIKAAQKLLLLWESGDKETLLLWRKMNNWVYDGFEKTYKDLGVYFNSYYYESETYLLGKEIINEGLKKNVFFTKTDGSVWIDLSSDGLDEKLLLRSDGTSVYITQDLGTAFKRIDDNPILNGMVYTVGNEQDYHFKVLFLILKKLGYNWADSLFHLSYGMVDLPSGKMKSREGTVVDADQLIIEMTSTAKKISELAGKTDKFIDSGDSSLYKMIGMGALKYYILKVDPKKRILFDPEESVDFNGNTGPFIQYTYARIKTLLNKTQKNKLEIDQLNRIDFREKNIIKQLILYPDIIIQAGQSKSPAIVANYLYDLVKSFNTFYQNISILGTDDKILKNFRVLLTYKVSEVISSACSILGIEVPDRM